MKKFLLPILYTLLFVTCKKSETNPVIATITTTAASAITATTAISGGNITADGGAPITARGVCWNTSTNPTISNSKTADGTGTGTFTSSLTGSTGNTTYFVRAYATNSTDTIYGNEISFTTLQSSATEVSICSQVWMIKNLDVTTYRNGDPIPKVSNDSTWYHLTTGAYCYYNNDSTTYAAMYGKLYNWYAVTDVRGLAPSGWHVPSDSEWTALSTCLGGDLVAGGKLKETGTAHWSSPNYGATNSSGFTGLPGGFRYNVGLFFSVGLGGSWWSSTGGGNYADSVGARYSSLIWGGEILARDYRIKKDGFSVRCVRD